MKISENISLASFTTFEIGGLARWFCEATSEAEIIEAVQWASVRNLPLFVLGGGSNLLVSDEGFSGLVLKVGLTGFSVCEDDGQGHTILQAAAGEEWEHCVQQSLELNLAGLECLAGIPGTVGGTPVQNVGAYGQEVATVIDRVRAFDRQTGKFVEFTNAECGFAYRHSRFNSKDQEKYLVCRVDYRLVRNGAHNVRYADLLRAMQEEAGKQNRTAESFSLLEVAEVVRAVRRSKGMMMVEGEADCRSAGSFFKNPAVPESVVRDIAEVCSKEPPHFATAQSSLFKIPAAWLIEQAGFPKGYRRGPAGISTRHTLALINRGGATAADVLALAEEIRAGVQTRFGIRLEMEPVHVGFPLEKIQR